MIDIIALKNQTSTITEWTNTLAIIMADTTQNMSDIANIITISNNMGIGLVNLVDNSNELSHQCIQDLSTIINFLEEKIKTTKTETTDLTDTFEDLANELNNINFNEY